MLLLLIYQYPKQDLRQHQQMKQEQNRLFKTFSIETFKAIEMHIFS